MGTLFHGGKDPTRAARRGSDWQLAVLMCRLCGDAVPHPCHFWDRPPPRAAQHLPAASGGGPTRPQPPVRRRGVGPGPPPAAWLRPAPRGLAARRPPLAATRAERAASLRRCWSRGPGRGVLLEPAEPAAAAGGGSAAG